MDIQGTGTSVFAAERRAKAARKAAAEAAKKNEQAAVGGEKEKEDEASRAKAKFVARPLERRHSFW